MDVENTDFSLHVQHEDVCLLRDRRYCSICIINYN